MMETTGPAALNCRERGSSSFDERLYGPRNPSRRGGEKRSLCRGSTTVTLLKATAIPTEFFRFVKHMIHNVMKAKINSENTIRFKERYFLPYATNIYSQMGFEHVIIVLEQPGE